MEADRQISKKSKSNFYLAFNLLPEEKRDAMNTVYAFCRKTDDIVDEGNEPDELKYRKLHVWRVELEKSISGNSAYPILNRLAKTIKHFNIPLEPFFDLIKGVEMDIQQKEYLKFDDLLQYCYRVASTVGLMSIEVFGYKKKSTRDYAVNLGLALQLTNILRDVKKDAEIGRIYLPQEDMRKFDVSKSQIIDGGYDDNFKELMYYEAERAKGFYAKADNALDFEDKPSLFAARAMQHIYFRLLKKLEANEFDIFSGNINVSRFEKTSLALGVWTKYALIY